MMGNKKLIIFQWAIIILLLILGIFGFIKHKDLVTKAKYQNGHSYVQIYESTNIKQLKKENKELYDSIKKLSNVESAIEIKYKYKYVTDTIKVTKFKYFEKDSLYHYINDNDTIKMEIDVKAKDLQWLTNKITINDKFTIINREKDNVNQTVINHSPNVDIENVDIWHRENKTKWYNNFHIGVQVGLGYGILNNKPDIFIGAGVSYTIK